MKFKTRWGTLAATTTLAMAGLVVGAGSAQAVTCSGHGCDWGNPYSSGCNTGSYVASEATMTNGIVLRLHYSPACRTVWGSIAGLPNGWSADVAVYSTDNNVSTCSAGPNSSDMGPTSCYTSMQYDGGITAYARGNVWASSGGSWTARTGNY
jgi:uncharacterized protein DUF2690